MKFLFDIFPIILFFVAFKFYGIYVATGVAIVASLLQIAYVYFSGKKIEYTLWVNVVIITLFGGLTLILHNEIFIKWKPTILYALFAVILFVSRFFFNKNLLRTLIGQNLTLSEPIWKKLNTSWVLFFSILAALNLFVAYSFSTEAWVNFKLFGLIGLTVVFVIAQSVWLGRHVVLEEDKE